MPAKKAVKKAVLAEPKIAELAAQPEGKYSVHYVCSNCDDSEHFIDIPRGQIANEFLAKRQCDHCGCSNVLKTAE